MREKRKKNISGGGRKVSELPEARKYSPEPATTSKVLTCFDETQEKIEFSASGSEQKSSPPN
jgi:hypothetical protein